jgi:DNA polymerase I
MELSQALDETDIVVLDVETLNVETFTGKDLIGVALGVPRGLKTENYFVYPEDLHKYKAQLTDKSIIAHNIMFDAEIMHQAGVPLNGLWYDTLTMAHLNNENEFSFGLDALARRYCKLSKIPMKPLVDAFNGWNNIPRELMADYAKNDAAITWSLFLYLTAKLAEQGLTDLYAQYMDYLKALVVVQRGGVLIDWAGVEERRVQTEQRLKQIQFKELRYDPASRSQLDRRLYQTLKVKPVGPPTKTGKPRTDAAALRAMRSMYPNLQDEIRLIFEYRRLQKANGTWYAGYQKFQDSTGLIHPNFKVHGTKTGRLSCESPNMQQIPREHSRVKALFCDNPAEGEVLVELDYSQVELRMASYYMMKVGDNNLYDAYRRGDDVHSRTAELVGAFAAIPNRREARNVGKEGNFLWLYGGGSQKLGIQLRWKYNLSCSERDCAEWTARFHEANPGLRRCIERCAKLHRRDGFITYFNGRRRHIRDRDSRGNTAHKDAWNSRIQGGCSQVLMYGLIRIHKAIEAGRIRARVVNTVHDSIWVYVPEDSVEEECVKMATLMRQVPEKVFKLPFKIDAKRLTTQEEYEFDGLG